MVSYFFESIVRSIVGFFYDWYVRSFYAFSLKAIGAIRSLEQIFALKVTIHYWLQPLYQDQTFLGYLLGLPLRTIRIAVAIIVYSVVLALFAAAYLLWAFALPFVIYKVFR